MLGWLRRTLTLRIAGDMHELEERLSQRLHLVEQRLAQNEEVLIRHGLQIARLEGRMSVQRLSLSIPAGSDRAETGQRRSDV